VAKKVWAGFGGDKAKEEQPSLSRVESVIDLTF
jgi:hypothetical protein